MIIKEGTRRMAKCPHTKKIVEQEYIGGDEGWLCLHKEDEDD